MEEKKENKKGFIGWLASLVKKCFIIFVPGIVVAVVLFMAINSALEPTSTPKFCGTLCHEMDVAYASWQKGAHFGKGKGVQVACIECHLPPREHFFSHVFAKAITGTKDTYKHLTKAEFNEEEVSKKVLAHFKNETCLRCHNNLAADELRAEIHEEILNPKEGEKAESCLECHMDAIHVRE